MPLRAAHLRINEVGTGAPPLPLSHRVTGLDLNEVFWARLDVARPIRVLVVLRVTALDWGQPFGWSPAVVSTAGTLTRRGPDRPGRMVAGGGFGA
jgi:hypothetical protein